MTKKILVVDNEVDLVEMIKLRLEANNYEVIVACDGAEALEKIKNERPDLIILDILMPRMNGYEFLRKVRKQKDSTKEIPVIIISARTRMKDLFDNWEISDFISKPFDAKELLSKIENVLAKVNRRKGINKKALIIGDETSAIGLIEAFLESHNFLVFTATNGLQGIEEAIKIQPELIFVQSVMKKMNGADICRILRKMFNAKRIPFIIFGAQKMGFMAKEAFSEEEIIEYSQSEDLIKKIGECLKKYS
jgi:DNA-binding response OmpR family regulator